VAPAEFVARLIAHLGGSSPREAPLMKIKTRTSKLKKLKKTGFRTRQKTVGGRKVNARQRRRHGSI
jgi:ribosomal protein L34